MEAMVERVCGLDIGQSLVVACLLVGTPTERPRKTIRKFGTMTEDLKELASWLRQEGCTHVVMESTGIYWEPIYNVLEGSFDLTVGNAQHIKNVPGRKTDVKDSEWLADLLRHGLVRKSFVPPREIRDLRILTRARRKWVETRTAERNRALKFLETINIKMASVMSDVFGVSGIAMLRAMSAGPAMPAELAKLAKGQLRKKVTELARALDGCITEQHRLVLRLVLERLDGLETSLDTIERQIDERTQPYEAELSLLVTIPGIRWTLATTIIAETGVDMSVFGSAHALAAWAGVAPGNHESAGRKKNARSRRGNVYLKTALVEAANAAKRKRGCLLQAKYLRLAKRRGKGRAALAIGNTIIVAVYHMLLLKQPYSEEGLSQAQPSGDQVAKGLLKRLQKLGYAVELKKLAA